MSAVLGASSVLAGEAGTPDSLRPSHVRIERYNIGNISQIEREVRRGGGEDFALVLYKRWLPTNLERNLATVTRITKAKLIDLDEESNAKHRHYLSFLFNTGSEWDQASLLAFFVGNNKVVKYTADRGGLRKVAEAPLTSVVGNPFSLLNYRLVGNYVYYFFCVAGYVKSLPFLANFSSNAQLYSLACGVGSAFAVVFFLVLVALNFNVDQLSERQKTLAGNKVRVSHPTQITSASGAAKKVSQGLSSVKPPSSSGGKSGVRHSKDARKRKANHPKDSK